MKKYSRPELKEDLIIDINESVYMICSGKDHFYNLSVGGDYQHQVPETGRYDCRYHASGDFTAESGYRYEGPVYCYLRFPITDVIVEHVNDWSTVDSWESGGYTYWVGVQNYTLQNGNEIGIGDLIASMSHDATQNVPIPDIAFSFGYREGTACV